MTYQLGHNISIAFDGMLVPFTDITFLPSFNLAVEASFQHVAFEIDHVWANDDIEGEVVDVTSDNDMQD